MPLLFVDQSSPSALKDSHRVQLARTHAITFALARQRQQRQRKGGNFANQTRETIRHHDEEKRSGKSAVPLTLSKDSSSLRSCSLDPFETLVVSAERLTVLLQLKTSVYAGEPVFSVGNICRYQGLHSISDAGLTDGALTAAISLSLAFAANDWKLDEECLQFKSTAIRQINLNLDRQATVALTSTIGAILLLLGTEYRLRESAAAQAHLNGIQALIRLCNERGILLPPALCRALYWQDLFSSIIAGTERRIHYEIYPIKHRKFAAHRSIREAPPGFLRYIDILGEEFVDIAADVHMLYRSRADLFQATASEQELENLDSLQAWMEGRLYDLRCRSSEPLLVSCIMAMFLCVYGFWDSTWNSALIPRALTTQLLHQFNMLEMQEAWEQRTDLVLWVTSVGSAFAIESSIRAKFDTLQQKSKRDINSEMPDNWDNMKRRLGEFIWSDIFYHPDQGSFWQRIGKC